MTLDKAVCREMNALLDASMIKLNHCLAQLTVEQIWWRPAEEINSIGNLLLHIAGNLRQWGVVPISGEPDRRERQKEFDQRDPLTADELMTIVASTVDEAKVQFSSLDEPALLSERGIQGFGVTLLGAIVHTTSHFVGHVQQIIMLTRLQLGTNYQFQWTDDLDRGNVPI